MDLPEADGTEGTLLCFATAAGKVASDGPRGQNGLYTSALLKGFATRGRRIEEIMKEVRKEVQQATNGKQVPWENTSLTGDGYPAGR